MIGCDRAGWSAVLTSSLLSCNKTPIFLVDETPGEVI